MALFPFQYDTVGRLRRGGFLDAVTVLFSEIMTVNVSKNKKQIQIFEIIISIIIFSTFPKDDMNFIISIKRGKKISQ